PGRLRWRAPVCAPMPHTWCGLTGTLRLSSPKQRWAASAPTLMSIILLPLDHPRTAVRIGPLCNGELYIQIVACSGRAARPAGGRHSIGSGNCAADHAIAISTFGTPAPAATPLAMCSNGLQGCSLVILATSLA